MSTPVIGTDDSDDRPAKIRAYKQILQELIDRRPAGTRGRLAAALETNRSFVSQITNARYDIPVPAQHLPTIFEVCHFSDAERGAVSSAYGAAHPRSNGQTAAPQPKRRLTLELVSHGDQAKNKLVDKMIIDFARSLSKLLE